MMNRNRRVRPWIVVFMIWGLSWAGSVAAEGAEGREAGSRSCCEKYDVEHEFEFTGVIEEFKTVDGKGEGRGGHLLVQGEKALYEVHLGPERYLESEKIVFDVGAEATVYCSPIATRKPKQLEDGRILLQVVARQVELDGTKVVFRDESGTPIWKGGRRGQAPNGD